MIKPLFFHHYFSSANMNLNRRFNLINLTEDMTSITRTIFDASCELTIIRNKILNLKAALANTTSIISLIT